ncbi:hypothetical protein C0989_006845, partial [Termitomyces sp. Mn162]
THYDHNSPASTSTPSSDSKPSNDESVRSIDPPEAEHAANAVKDTISNLEKTVEVEILPLTSASDLSPEDIEEDVWEEEHDDAFLPASLKVKPWSVLQEQIKKKLKKGEKTLSMLQFNQLMVLHNFATLREKVYGWTAASNEIE